MAKSKDLFKFHGKLDDVVGYKRFGQHYDRMSGCTHKTSNTPKQLEIRARFKAVTSFITNIGHVYNEGYRHFNSALPARSSFFRQLWYDALIGNMTDGFSIDPTKVMIARGPLTPCHTIAASVATATQTITISWSDNTGVGDAQETDQLMYCFYNMTKQTNIYGNNVAARAAETYSTTYPADWSGDTCYLYVAWSSGSTESVSKMLGVFSA